MTLAVRDPARLLALTVNPTAPARPPLPAERFFEAVAAEAGATPVFDLLADLLVRPRRPADPPLYFSTAWPQSWASPPNRSTVAGAWRGTWPTACGARPSSTRPWRPSARSCASSESTASTPTRSRFPTAWSSRSRPPDASPAARRSGWAVPWRGARAASPRPRRSSRTRDEPPALAEHPRWREAVAPHVEATALPHPREPRRARAADGLRTRRRSFPCSTPSSPPATSTRTSSRPRRPRGPERSASR